MSSLYARSSFCIEKVKLLRSGIAQAMLAPFFYHRNLKVSVFKCKKIKKSKVFALHCTNLTLQEVYANNRSRFFLYIKA